MNGASPLAQVRGALERGEVESAVSLLPSLLQPAEPSSEALHLAALVQTGIGQFSSAAELLQRAIQGHPAHPGWHRDLAIVYLSLGAWNDAIKAFKTSIELAPRDARAWRGLARALISAGRSLEAYQALRHSLDLDPHSKSAHVMMAAADRDANQFDYARRHEEEILRLDAGDWDARARLALDCWRSDNIPGALQHSRAVVDSGVASPTFHSLHLYLRLFDPAETGETLRSAYEQWALRHCPVHQPRPPLTNPDPERRLRVGYISAEFIGGPPLFFLSPIIAGHDRTQVEVFLYHTSASNDEHTDWFREHADHWRECHSLTDSSLLQTIHNDQIDILVDPSGYSREHRLTVLARRAAPIQVAYPSYPSTRGIRQLDYFLTDPWATPYGTESHYTETPVRLPSGLFAYAPPPDSPPVTPLPAEANGFITYGLFARRVKLNSGVLDAVAEVLRQSPASRLLIQHSDPTLDQPHSETSASLVREFLYRGIRESRIRFAGARPRREVMLLMAETDIVLDAFPFAGHTTTCECLWMGVPVVTLSGATHASRVGASILNSVGLPEFVTGSPAQYVATAIAAGAGLPQLAALRSAMRERLEKFGLVASCRLSREIETAFRQLWREWCRQQQQSSTEVTQ